MNFDLQGSVKNNKKQNKQNPETLIDTYYLAVILDLQNNLQ